MGRKNSGRKNSHWKTKNSKLTDPLASGLSGLKRKLTLFGENAPVSSWLVSRFGLE